MIRLRRSPQRPRPEVNVTPLVDVVLVLLIIFLVVTPYLQRGALLDLPLADHAETPQKTAREPLVVSLRRDGSIWLGTSQVSREALGAAVRAALRRNPNLAVLLKGDEALTYGDVREVLTLLRESGAPGVSLAAEKRNRG